MRVGSASGFLTSMADRPVAASKSPPADRQELQASHAMAASRQTPDLIGSSPFVLRIHDAHSGPRGLAQSGNQPLAFRGSYFAGSSHVRVAGFAPTSIPPSLGSQTQVQRWNSLLAMRIRSSTSVRRSLTQPPYRLVYCQTS